MDGWDKEEEEMFALSHVGFCWSSGRAPRAYARLLRQYDSIAAERRRNEALARLEAPGKSGRIGAIRPRREFGVDVDHAGWEDVIQQPFPPSPQPSTPPRTVFY